MKRKRKKERKKESEKGSTKKIWDKKLDRILKCVYFSQLLWGIIYKPSLK